MRILIALGCLLAALPAGAANENKLRGQWRIDAPTQAGYVGIVLVDAEGRVSLDSPEDNGRPAKFRGYIERNTTTGIKIVLTDGAKVAFVYCAAETFDRLHCYASRADGVKSDAFTMTRVATGPMNLTRELP